MQPQARGPLPDDVLPTLVRFAERLTPDLFRDWSDEGDDEELSLDEIAKVTRAPLSTVKSRLYRGLAAIRPKLERAGVHRLEAV